MFYSFISTQFRVEPKGIELLCKSKKKRKLKKWIEEIKLNCPESILEIDMETVHIWGMLTAAAQKSGKVISVCDGLIAATAKQHGLHIMTRNITDFEYTGALIINPWLN